MIQSADMDTIDYDTFSKIELKVATVIQAERIEGSEKLMRLQLDLSDHKRKILAGISQEYSPESLVEKQIIIVANLEPRKMMGEESQGMLLCADAEKPVLLTVSENVPPGTKIR